MISFPDIDSRLQVSAGREYLHSFFSTSSKLVLSIVHDSYWSIFSSIQMLPETCSMVSTK
jgi:hypothetical protein